jgi:hypothetical protein
MERMRRPVDHGGDRDGVAGESRATGGEVLLLLTISDARS